MKSLFLSLFTLIALPVLAGDLALNFNELTTFSTDYKIVDVLDVRVQALSSSKGGAFRRDCYKEYRSNFPYSAQVTPYTYKQNLLARKENKTTIVLEGLKEVFTKNAKSLKEDINWGCKVETSLMGLVTVKLSDGGKANSNFSMTYNNEELKLTIGSYTRNVKFNSEVKTDLTPTVFYGDNWETVWQDFDPAVGNPQSNY